jgi:hypothetical protein
LQILLEASKPCLNACIVRTEFSGQALDVSNLMEDREGK